MATELVFAFESHYAYSPAYSRKAELCEDADIVHFEYIPKTFKITGTEVILEDYTDNTQQIRNWSMVERFAGSLLKKGKNVEPMDFAGATDEESTELKRLWTEQKIESASGKENLPTIGSRYSNLRDAIYAREFLKRLGQGKFDGKKVVSINGASHTLRMDLLKGLLKGKEIRVSEHFIDYEIGAIRKPVFWNDLDWQMNKYGTYRLYEDYDEIKADIKKYSRGMMRLRYKKAKELMEKGNDPVDSIIEAVYYSKNEVYDEDGKDMWEHFSKYLNDVLEKRKQLQNGIGLDEFLPKELIESWV